MHQTNHWVAKGEYFFGDHKLFEQLYDSTNNEIDTVAEKAIGYGGERVVSLSLQLKQLAIIDKSATDDAIKTSSSLAKKSLECETRLLMIIPTLLEMMRASGTLTSGIENMVNQLQDDHEKHVYLLKQRCGE